MPDIGKIEQLTGTVRVQEPYSLVITAIQNLQNRVLALEQRLQKVEERLK